jgi:hypothetical protein
MITTREYASQGGREGGREGRGGREGGDWTYLAIVTAATKSVLWMPTILFWAEGGKRNGGTRRGGSCMGEGGREGGRERRKERSVGLESSASRVVIVLVVLLVLSDSVSTLSSKGKQALREGGGREGGRARRMMEASRPCPSPLLVSKSSSKHKADGRLPLSSSPPSVLLELSSVCVHVGWVVGVYVR